MNIQNDYTLSGYISAPLSSSELSAYKINVQNCMRYETRLLRQYAAVAISIGCGIFICLSMLTEDVGVLRSGLVGLLFATLIFMPALLSLGSKSLAKFPMSLVIDGEDFILGTTGKEFEYVDVNCGNIPEGSSAYKLMQAILSESRPILAFEKKF